MLYTVASEIWTKKEIDKAATAFIGAVQYGETGSGNGSEDNATVADSEFEAYLADGDVDFYEMLINNSDNISINKADKYLPYRFLLGEQKQISLGHECLKQEGFDNLGIKVKISPTAVSKNSSGHFDSYYGNIWFRKVFRTVHPVTQAAHEADHAKRFAVIGQLGKRRTPYEQKAEKVLGLIEDPQERAKGYDYLVASEHYPKLSADEDLTKNKAYWDNLLEVLARQKEEETAKEYNAERSQLQKEFKYILGEDTL